MSTTFSGIAPHASLSEDTVHDLDQELFNWGVDPSDTPEVMRLIREHIEGLAEEHKEVSIVVDSDFPKYDILFKSWTVVGTAHNFDGEGYIHIGYTHDGWMFITVVRPDLRIPPMSAQPSESEEV